MNDEIARGRISWTARINLRPSAIDAIRTMAKLERLPVATLIGEAVESYITARSSV